VNRLVYLEVYKDVLVAIRREKEIKGWTRKKKIALIESVNPNGKTWRQDGENNFRLRRGRSRSLVRNNILGFFGAKNPPLRMTRV